MHRLPWRRNAGVIARRSLDRRRHATRCRSPPTWCSGSQEQRHGG